ncbi:hypothetical protein BH09PSE4_BH09PSE4_12190 [soil metagenome]
MFFVAAAKAPAAFSYQDVLALADDRQNGQDDLDSRIARAKAEHVTGITSAEAASESRGWAIGIEFVGVVLVSTLIGWGIDNYTGLGTKPWAMIFMLVLGFVAGVYRAMKTSSQFDADPTDTTK